MMDNRSTTFKSLLTIISIIMLILGLFFLLKQNFTNRISIEMSKEDSINANINMIPMPLPGFVSNQVDDSMDISFITPNGMVEDNAMAKALGIYKVYKSANHKKISPESLITISFSKKNDKLMDLKSFILSNLNNATESIARQEAISGPMRLPKDVIKKFVDMRIPYQTVLLIIDPANEKLVASCAIFFFETPAGFWSVNWTAPKKLLIGRCREKDIFLSLIKFMIIGIKQADTYEIHM